MNIKIQVTKTLSEEDIMDIFVSAIETSDIHFWCCRLEIEDGWELLLKKEELESEDLVNYHALKGSGFLLLSPPQGAYYESFLL